MTRFEASTERLDSGGSEIRTVGTRAAGVGGGLAGEAGNLGEAAGFPEAAGPLEDFLATWTRAVAETGRGVETLGEVVVLAARAYRTTDENAMPARRG